MVTGKPSQPTSRDEFEIAIVCTRALEYDAVCLLLDHFWDTDGDPFGRARGDLNTYTTGYMGNYNIVLVLLCNSGKANAAGAAASLRSSYPCIELLLLAGICEGVPDANGEQLLLGDVVISETVIQYDLGTQFAAEFREKDTLEDRHGRANKNIRNFTANIIKTERGSQRLEEKAALHLEQIQNRALEIKDPRRCKATTYMYPGSANDILFESTHCHKHYNSSQCVCADHNPDEDLYAVCDESRDLDCEQTGCELNYLKTRDRLQQQNLLENARDRKFAQIPSIFVGRFGSGDTAFRSGIHRDSLARKHGIIAFEMEGAGVWDELPCIIVKGVSDYGDGHKTKHWAKWQTFAAATAASVARALVECYPQTDKSPATTLQLQEDKACLNALFITNPEDDKRRIEETKGGLLLDACIWITISKEFMQWLEDPEIRLLWIKGDPGKGKTMMLCGIINELKAAKFGRNIYYFLCQATDDSLNSASAILRGLLHMIVIQQPSLISYIRDEYDKSGKSAFKDTNSWIVLSRIFEQILRDDSLNEPIFIIDALDECVTNSAKLLEMITKSSSSSSRVKWLVSSRNEADVLEALAGAKHKSTMNLELNAKSVSAAITTYIQHKMEVLVLKKGYTVPKIDQLRTYLSDNADGTFLWVALVCARLEKASRFDRLPDLAEFPPGLDKLYERMMSRVCGPGASDFGRRVLAIATVAHRPLNKYEFISLINNYGDDIGDIKPEDDTWENILGHCGSFLTIRNDIIYFVHQSAKDFIVEYAVQQLFPNGTEFVHREILEASISAMRRTLRKDIYDLVDPAFSMDNLLQRDPSDDPLIHIKYSCIYWIDHFEQSIHKSKGDDDDHSKSHEAIYNFLREKYIYWLEVSSLLRSIFDGMVRMQKLEQLVVNTQIPELLRLAWDARRFIQTFGTGIADFPLQVYVSALIFSPTQSITRQLFEKEAPEWIVSLPDGEAEWAPSSRTYEGSEKTKCLAVSYCGTWIASISSQNTITTWETSSGKIIRISRNRTRLLRDFTDVDKTSFVCFSPWNSKELASAWFLDDQVNIWDVTTGELRQQLRINSQCTSISYLISSRNTLGCLTRRLNGMTTAFIWNTETGKMIKKVPLQKLSHYAEISRFSLVYASKVREAGDSRQHIKIVNIDTGSVIRTLEYDNGVHVYEMRFSPDGSLLAVFAYSRGMRRRKGIYYIILSDIASGETKWTFGAEETHLQPNFTFSNDGKLLAIATLEGIHVLSAASGKCLRKMIMKSKHVIFSSDGRKVFSTNDSVIDVVDTGIENDVAPSSSDSLGREIIERKEVSLSPNGRLVASVLLTNPLLPVIEIMDIFSKTLTHTLGIPSGARFLKKCTQPLFSPDSMKLALTSDSEIILWDITSKFEKPIFTWKNVAFNWLMKNTSRFSSDSDCLATVLYGSANQRYGLRLKVIDTSSGECLMYLGKKRDVKDVSLCFSPDNRRLAISSLYESRTSPGVEIWEIASVSALLVIDLDYYHLFSHSPAYPLRIYEKEDQEDETESEELVEAVKKERKKDETGRQLSYRDAELSFYGNSHLILDLYTNTHQGNKGTSIRVVIRTNLDTELPSKPNSNIFRAKESKSYDIDSTGSWIEFNGERLVWIPPQCRNRAAQDAQQNCVALSHSGGSLSIIQFRHGLLAKQTSPSYNSILGHIPSMPEMPEMPVYTYLRHLEDDWKIVCHDMNTPDNDILEKISTVDTFKNRLDAAHKEVMFIYTDLKWEIMYQYDEWKRKRNHFRKE